MVDGEFTIGESWLRALQGMEVSEQAQVELSTQ